MEEPHNSEISKSNQTFDSFFREKGVRFASNTGIGVVSLGIELARWSQFNLRGREHFGTNTRLPAEPLLTIMQSLGDVGPGFFISALGYEAIDILTSPIEWYSGKRVPEEIKIGAAVFLGMAAIIAHEKGKFFVGASNNNNLLDIIGGSVGPIAFAGFQMMLNRFIKKVDVQIELEKEKLLDSGIKAPDLDLI